MQRTFFVPGLPRPQGSKTAIMVAGKPRLIEGGPGSARKAFKEWRAAVQAAATKVRAGLTLDEPVSVYLTFYMPLPASDRYRVRHAVVPDGDKLQRAVCDALTASCLVADDSRIWQYLVAKVYAHGTQPIGVRVHVVGDGEQEAKDRAALRAGATQLTLRLEGTEHEQAAT
jgi:Holliday junction resolvase RusA-like endonuclease